LKRQPIVDIVETLVSRLTFTEEILEAVDNLDGTWTVTLCDIHNLRPCSEFSIEGVDYEVQTIGPGETVTFASTNTIQKGESLTVPAPKYYHGTLQDVNIQLSKEDSVQAMTPMVFLVEHITEDVNFDRTESIGRTAPINLLFLDRCEFEEWNNDERYEYSVTPMYNLEQDFEQVLYNEGGIRDQAITTASVTYHSKFGEVIRVGNKNLEFPYETGGVGLRVTLQIDKKGICGSCDACDC